MTEHVVPVDGHVQGVVALHGRADRIRVVAPCVLSLDSIGFGRLNVAWEVAASELDALCLGCELCVEHGPVPAAELVARHLDCAATLHCGACGHHACPASGA